MSGTMLTPFDSMAGCADCYVSTNRLSDSDACADDLSDTSKATQWVVVFDCLVCILMRSLKTMPGPHHTPCIAHCDATETCQTMEYNQHESHNYTNVTEHHYVMAYKNSAVQSDRQLCA